ncbi:MAG: SoxR reducing system RseC family protein [Alistipes sp.]|jgi:sigma-E factor negative regulatory protein RseC|nr:SoxR reducing system RseC family protein [Alistipes sp.]MBO7194436.1 SoxR reducing system RseC family protein [Alistipes sp.]
MSQIKHSGEVVRIEYDTVYVKMTVNSACSGCHAKAVCGVNESEDKIVEVSDVVAADYSVGEVVQVALQSNSMGTKAVVLTYVVPFFILTLLLVGALWLGLSEGVSALVALGGVALYCVVLYTLRHRIKNTIKFIIIK